MSRHQRITNGQRACVAGLVIAGLSLGLSCKIAGAPYRYMLEHLPPGWHEKRMPRRKWRGDRLDQLQRAYADRSLTVETVARLFRTDAGMVRQIARREGWQRRPQGMISNETRLLYRKLRPFVAPRVFA